MTTSVLAVGRINNATSKVTIHVAHDGEIHTVTCNGYRGFSDNDGGAAALLAGIEPRVLTTAVLDDSFDALARSTKHGRRT